jgi:MinD superfamily P-loop ATPase
MSFRIAIASGKGGTGKTCVATNLFKVLSALGKTVSLVDCDVEEPNSALFFKDKREYFKDNINIQVPQIDIDKCQFCGKCNDNCQFNAISLISRLGIAEINADLCHTCGVCEYLCEFDAISELEYCIGSLKKYETKCGNLVEAKLRVGSPAQTRLIKKMKLHHIQNDDYIILDSPPGTSCSVVETVVDANFVVLVTEPTPFGLYDLSLTINLLNQLGKDYGVVVNKSIRESDIVDKFLDERSIELMQKIPYSISYAKEYSTIDILNSNKFESSYIDLAQKLISKAKANE